MIVVDGDVQKGKTSSSLLPSLWLGPMPLGEGLRLHGHGLREHQVRGPLEVGGLSVLAILFARRYHCLACGGVATVVPRGVRGRTSPWAVVGATAVTGWLSPHRWVRAIREKRLFPNVQFGLDWTTRQVTARAAAVVAGRGPSELRFLAPRCR